MNEKEKESDRLISNGRINSNEGFNLKDTHNASHRNEITSNDVIKSLIQKQLTCSVSFCFCFCFCQQTFRIKHTNIVTYTHNAHMLTSASKSLVYFSRIHKCFFFVFLLAAAAVVSLWHLPVVNCIFTDFFSFI